MKEKITEYIDKGKTDYENKEGLDKGTILRKNSRMLITRMKEYSNKFIKKNNKLTLKEVNDENDEVKIIFVED